MRIIRYLAEDGTIRFAAQKAPGSHFDISGNIFGDFQITGHQSAGARRFSPALLF
jgi:hypothetical protein